MNRDQKTAVIEEIATQMKDSEAIFAVDYRGISVPQAAELRTKLREADASFRIVKNSLTERAADQAGTESLKALLEGPTALAFVRGDAAAAAKAIADYGRATDLLPFKGGILNGETLEPGQIRSIARLPSRDVLYGQLVGLVASPIGGLVRSLNALIGGLALQLGQIAERKQSGELPGGEAPAAEATPVAEPEPEPVPVPVAEPEPEPEPAAEAEPEPVAEREPEPAAESAPEQAEPEIAPADNDNPADASEVDGTAEAKE